MNISNHVVSAVGRCPKYAVYLLIAIGSMTNGVGNQAAAQISGVSYTVTPSVGYLNLDSDGAVDGGLFAGGRIGFGFGEIMELGGVYSRGIGLKSNLMIDGVLVPSRNVAMSTYGGELKVNLMKGRYNPFISVGAGILNISPDNVIQTETIYLGLGAGVQLRVRDRYTAAFQLMTNSYKYNPTTSILSLEEVATLGVDPANTSDVSIRNFGARVGLQFYLGGQARGTSSETDRALRDQFSHGLRGLSVQVEPVASAINFDDGLGFRDKQRFVGGSLGMVVGPYFDLRAFYWRGTKDGSWTKLDKLNTYGGEVRFKFENFTGSVVPFVLLGGGYLDVLDGYQSNELAEASSRSFAMVGAGIGLPLSNAVTLNGGVKTILMSIDGLSESSLKGSVLSNTGYSAGLSFGVGRNQSAYDGMLASNRRSEEEIDMELARMRYELDQAIARTDSMASKLNVDVAPIVFDSTAASELANSERSATDPTANAPSSMKPGVPGSSGIQADLSNRWVTIPVPQEGELYVRYGPPGGVIMESFNGGEAIGWYDPTTGKIIQASPGSTESGQGAVNDNQMGPRSSPSSIEIERAMRKILKEEAMQAALRSDSVVTRGEIEELIRQLMVEMRYIEPAQRDSVARDTTVVSPALSLPINKVSVPFDSTLMVPDSTLMVPDSTLTLPDSTGISTQPDSANTQLQKATEKASPKIPSSEKIGEGSSKDSSGNPHIP